MRICERRFRAVEGRFGAADKCQGGRLGLGCRWYNSVSYANNGGEDVLTAHEVRLAWSEGSLHVQLGARVHDISARSTTI